MMPSGKSTCMLTRNYWIMRDLGKPNCSLANPRAAQKHGRIAGLWQTQDDCDGWVCAFGKRNCSLAGPRRALEVPKLAGVWRQGGDPGEGFHVTVLLELPTWMIVDAGAPRHIWLEIQSKSDDPRLYVDVVWIDKTPTRLPEALWYKFAPDAEVADPQSWLMYKLGQPISPLEVVNNGSQSMHGVGDEGISVSGRGARSWETLAIRSLDVSLVSPGEANPFPKAA
eukprot:jgi/Botrbrau1/16249/Bobra.0066s0034.1